MAALNCLKDFDMVPMGFDINLLTHYESRIPFRKTEADIINFVSNNLGGKYMQMWDTLNFSCQKTQRKRLFVDFFFISTKITLQKFLDMK